MSRILRAAGIHNFNIDLIAGLPGQTEASWRESLDWIERLEPPHVSVYMLEVDEDSRLGSEMLLGGVALRRRRHARRRRRPPRSTKWRSSASRPSASARYEISNFARPGFESLHNLKYWKLEPYVGFGADAHSFDGARAGRMSNRVADYLAARRPGVEPSVPAPDEERFFVGLRLIARHPPRPPTNGAASRAPIRRFLDAGLLETADGILRLTRRGVLLSNEVFQEFLHCMIDLRSDTVTKPTPAMRHAMFEAEVGDDVYGEDPTVNRLEQRAAEITGKEAALFVPTGTMGNTIAIKLLTEHGQEVICDSRAHLLDYELSMVAWFSGCLIRAIPHRRRHPALGRDPRAASSRRSAFWAPTGLIEIENTHNMAGRHASTRWKRSTRSATARTSAASRSTWMARASSTRRPPLRQCRCARSSPKPIP